MTLPATAKTVGELAEILSHLPQDMKVVIDDDSVRAATVEVMMDDEWTDRNWTDHAETVIKLQVGDML